MNEEQLRKTFSERGIRRVKVGGFDVDGVLRGKYINLEKFWSSLDKGFGFCDVIFGWDIADKVYDNAGVTGPDTGYPDALAKIDPSTFRISPYEPEVAHFLVDFCLPNGKPHPACPRSLLKRTAARAEAAGYTAMFSGEFEFWVFRETPQSMREKGFQNLEPLSPGMFGYSWLRQAQHGDFVRETLDVLDAYDIDVEGFHTETGPGVWEGAIRYDDVVRAADKAALFKTVMKRICHEHGLACTFMAKWNSKLPGSSGHLHQSLWSAGTNVFADAKAPDRLSQTARHYVGGLAKMAPELTALYSPFVNTYKRYVPGVWAPMSASWGIDNRTCAIRVINGPSDDAVRFELRQTAADINPYLAMAGSLGSGLYGIEHAIEPSEPAMGDATGPAEGREALPLTLRDATDRLAKSETAREILGESFVDHYVRTREWELREYQQSVTNWELERYFESV